MTNTSDAEEKAETARADLVHTLGQLRDNLKPANLVDEAVATAKLNAAAWSEQVATVARQNPLPALMIGAGLAMLLGVGARNGVLPGTRRPPRPLADPTAARWRAPDDPGVETSLGERVHDALGDANDKLRTAAARGAALAKATLDTARWSDPMSRSRQSVGSSLVRLVEDQPLILGAVGVALGAALGAALPHSRVEDEVMGETSGSLKAAALGLAQDQMAQARTAAEHAVADIKQTVAQHGVNADNLSDLVHEVGEKATSAAYEAGRPAS